MLETDRLALRPLSADDLEAWADFLGDADATRLTHVPGPVDRELAAKLLARWVAKGDGPVGTYAVVVRASGETAGFVATCRGSSTGATSSSSAGCCAARS